MRGSGILDEFPAWECGQLLWESYRNVGDWALRPRHRRGAPMFGSAAAEMRTAQLGRADWVDPELRAALEVIRDMLADPRGAGAHALALACRRVSAWAGAHGKPATQFYFAAAAGLCVPEDARQAYHAGSLARDLAKWDAAEAWLEYAVAAARRRRDRETQTLAVLGIGNMFYRQGLYRRAREAQGAALVLARKHGLGEMQGRALHDLFITCAETQDLRRAEENARLALEAYGSRHPSVPLLAHDVALFWLNNGYPARALNVLTALLPRMQLPIHRIHVLASIGWAAGCCGDRELFERSWAGVWALADTSDARPRAAPSLLQVAYGAAGLAETTLAGAAARAALDAARKRGEADVITRAETLLAGLETGALPTECSSQAPAPPAERSGDRLVEELAQSLHEV
ncbi:MAG TPA: hypothetical protein VF263_05130 [Longimicrobiaceae bacterium]